MLRLNNAKQADACSRELRVNENGVRSIFVNAIKVNHKVKNKYVILYPVYMSLFILISFIQEKGER